MMSINLCFYIRLVVAQVCVEFQFFNLTKNMDVFVSKWGIDVLVFTFWFLYIFFYLKCVTKAILNSSSFVVFLYFTLLHRCRLASSAEAAPSLICSPEHRMRVILWQQQEHPISSWTETLSASAAAVSGPQTHSIYFCCCCWVSLLLYSSRWALLVDLEVLKCCLWCLFFS